MVRELVRDWVRNWICVAFELGRKKKLRLDVRLAAVASVAGREIAAGRRRRKLWFVESIEDRKGIAATSVRPVRGRIAETRVVIRAQQSSSNAREANHNRYQHEDQRRWKVRSTPSQGNAALGEDERGHLAQQGGWSLEGYGDGEAATERTRVCQGNRHHNKEAT